MTRVARLDGSGLAFAVPRALLVSDLVRAAPGAAPPPGGRLADDIEITAVAPISAARPGALSFFTGDAAAAAAVFPTLPAGAVVVCGLAPADLEAFADRGVTFLITDRPRRWFITAVRALLPDPPISHRGISPLASIAEDVTLGPDVVVAPFVVIDPGVRIGARSVLFPGVHVMHDVEIGADVLIQSNSSIGGEGQANEKTDDGVHATLPHLGAVRIGDGTRIGMNSCILRGSLQDTRIGQRCRIGNQVNIGHNVTVGNDVFVSAGSVLAGSCIIGDGCWLAPSVTVINKATIGPGTTVGIGSVVTRSHDGDGMLAGNPARAVRKQNTYNT